MVVIFQISDVHYNDSEHHYFEPRQNVVMRICSDAH